MRKIHITEEQLHSLVCETDMPTNDTTTTQTSKPTNIDKNQSTVTVNAQNANDVKTKVKNTRAQLQKTGGKPDKVNYELKLNNNSATNQNSTTNHNNQPIVQYDYDTVSNPSALQTQWKQDTTNFGSNFRAMVTPYDAARIMENYECYTKGQLKEARKQKLVNESEKYTKKNFKNRKR